MASSRMLLSDIPRASSVDAWRQAASGHIRRRMLRTAGAAHFVGLLKERPMIVQRLFRWFSRVFESLRGRNRQVSVRGSERLVAAGSQAAQGRGNTPSRGATMAVSWLDDSLRLRPHADTTISPDLGWANKRSRQHSPSTEHATQATPLSQQNPPAPHTIEATTPTTQGPLKSGLSHSQQDGTRQPLQPVSTAPATTETRSGMDDAQRRLIFLRYLVRQGIYNEGFSRAKLPEQYRYSGADGGLPPSEE